MQCWQALSRAKQLSTAATSLAPKLHMRSWVVYIFDLKGKSDIEKEQSEETKP